MDETRGHRVLGIDPGTHRVGFALLEAGARRRLIASGVVTVPAAWEPERRLGRIHTELAALIDRHQPDCIALESSFFGKNVLSMLRLGEARGCVLALAGVRGLTVSDYPPATVKKAVTGNGGASKRQLARVLAALLPELGSAEAIERLDETDAIGIAWCHFEQERVTARKALVAKAVAAARETR